MDGLQGNMLDHSVSSVIVDDAIQLLLRSGGQQSALRRS